jgi:hypothetical protein
MRVAIHQVCAFVPLLLGFHALGNDPVIFGWEEDGAPFFTDRETLIREAAWVPGSGELPNKLETFVSRGRLEVANADQLTNRIDLQSITLKRLTVPRKLREKTGLSLEQITNKWFVTLTFIPQNTLDPRYRRPRYVWMLLSGTLLKTTSLENPTTVRPSSNVRLPNLNAAVTSGITGTVFEQSSGINVYEYLKTGRFALPLIQWDATTPFPMDLAAQIPRVQSKIQESPEKSWPNSLNEISLTRYFPEGAVSAANQDMENHRWHWLVAFQYGPPIKELKGSQNVDMLLDGRIVPTDGSQLE